jgi:hypothetical protein
MPKRTTPKQEVIALLRRLLAKEGCAITESAMLQDARTSLQREVDIVMECHIGDVQVTVSFEVIDHKRKADILWVEQMLKSMRPFLPTNLFSFPGQASAQMLASSRDQNPTCCLPRSRKAVRRSGYTWTRLLSRSKEWS